MYTLFQISAFGDVLLLQCNNIILCVNNKALCKIALCEVVSLKFLRIYPRRHIFTKGINVVFKAISVLLIISLQKELIIDYDQNM